MQSNYTVAASMVAIFSFTSCAHHGSATASDGLLLKQAALADRWQVNEEGDGVRYVDPNSSLTFFYISKKAVAGPIRSVPPLIEPMYAGETAQAPPGKAQSWKYTQIMGQTVRWYQQDEGGGADFPAFVTEVFPVTTALGKREYYQIIVCHGMQGDYVREIDSWMRGVSLR